MNGDVFLSSIMDDYQIGNKQGLRWKFPGGEWSSPTHVMPPATEESVARLNRYNAGYRLAECDVPEALAVWDKKAFAATGDIFTARGMYAVKAPIAEILSRFDLGENGLTPLKIYEDDLMKPVNGEFWLLNLCVRKDTFLPEQSNQDNYRVRQLTVDRETGLPIWKTSLAVEDGDVAVSQEALKGSDLWVEARMWQKLFMSGRLAEALSKAKLKKVDFRLKQCRVVEG